MNVLEACGQAGLQRPLVEVLNASLASSQSVGHLTVFSGVSSVEPKGVQSFTSGTFHLAASHDENVC